MEKMIQIPEWKLKRIEDAIRITLNAYKMRTKETCLFRQMCKASEYANEALGKSETSASGLNIDIVVGQSEQVLCACNCDRKLLTASAYCPTHEKTIHPE